MLNWIRNALSTGANFIDSSIRSLISTVVGGLASLIDTVFGNVSGAWHDLASAFDAADRVIGGFTSALWHHIETLVTHDIPVWAQGAYWWVTHPGQLATVLLWPILRQLENNAWTAAEWLGEFAVALLVRNVVRLAQTAETVLAAIL